MIPSATIELVEVENPINGPVTKFGGQPHWLEKPQWPQSRSLGVPMKFICQIALADVPGLPESLSSSGRLAYVFMAGEAENTFDPESGENAVILQPGGGQVLVPTVEQATGPSADQRECAVRLTLQEEPELLDPETGLRGAVIDELEDDEQQELLDSNKLGGAPCFIQGMEYPPGDGPWLPILQLHDYNESFEVNFGSGTGYVFVSEDGREGRLLWQC